MTRTMTEQILEEAREPATRAKAGEVKAVKW